MRRDLISLIAMIGAPLFVGVSLFYSIINGQWEHVAFIAIIFAIVFLLYIRFIPLSELDDEVPVSNMKNPEANAGESTSSDHKT
jgi:hypothetical protein